METEKLTEKKFWSSVWILIHNYHAINRKIFACIIEDIFTIQNNVKDIVSAIDPTVPVKENDFSLKRCTEPFLYETLQNPSGTNLGFLIKHKLLTKNQQENISAISIIDFRSTSCIWKFGNSSNLDDFVVEYNGESLIFRSLTQRNALESGDRWLQYVLKPKLMKWASSTLINSNKKSLQLIDVEAYSNLYKHLKCKYSEKLKGIWIEANESTDPLKFIYEDLAIAAYLICLWKSENVKQSSAFADLGCGNGLLVYVLNEEGYAGYGYDIRRRKLWSLYPKTVQDRLKEAAIVPFEFAIPREVDWLIGNHSDELSPWIAVLAALERFEMSYFLLPCCAYEFSGAKFQRRNAKISTYQDFYEYARDISQLCGFRTLEDRLKIPSTKRLALIGCDRTYDDCYQHALKCEEIRKFAEAEMLKFPHAHAQEDASQIKLREKNECVRNCTKLDKDFLASLVDKIFNLLLRAAAPSSDVTLLNNCDWHAGGRLSMQEIVENLTQAELKNIKSECGGIKTLLRNKHEIFEFFGNNLIGLRKPKKRVGGKPPPPPPHTLKRRSCYFNVNHPNGCPLSDEDCSFLHQKSR